MQKRKNRLTFAVPAARGDCHGSWLRWLQQHGHKKQNHSQMICFNKFLFLFQASFESCNLNSMLDSISSLTIFFFSSGILIWLPDQNETTDAFQISLVKKKKKKKKKSISDSLTGFHCSFQTYKQQPTAIYFPLSYLKLKAVTSLRLVKNKGFGATQKTPFHHGHSSFNFYQDK